jgi:hypothetical protein
MEEDNWLSVGKSFKKQVSQKKEGENKEIVIKK